MPADLQILGITAITIALLHTVSGPDHYIPFIALSRTKKWSLQKTIGWTIICGCGHVWSSALLGLAGALLGWSLSSVSWLENVRGGIAGWALLGFGVVYGLWGLHRARQRRLHKHFDVNEEGSIYVYEHRIGETVAPGDRHRVTPWVMFLIFVLGPCEPMIPLLYFPAAKHDWWVMLLLVIIYTVCTLAAMLLMVCLGYFGFQLFRTAVLEKYMHALGGLSIFLCGAGMLFLGW